MAKFVVLYRASQSALDQMSSATPEQAKAGMDAWMTWADDAGDAVVDLGAPLGDASRIGTTQAPNGDLVCGFSILQADSKGELVGMLQAHPHLQIGGSIEVLEFIALPEM